jgi:SET domain-containing protein
MARTFLVPTRITVGTIPGKGRGVIATAAIAANEVIEISPILICPEGSIPETGHPLSDHAYSYGDGLAIALGYGSLYNHSRNPNCIWHFDEQLPAMIITATRAIGPGEELTIDYGIPLWFLEA